MKIDVLVDDGLNVISRTSYVFPTRLLQLCSQTTSAIQSHEQLGGASGNFNCCNSNLGGGGRLKLCI